MKNFNNIYESVYKKCYEPLEEIRKSEKNKKIIVLSIISILNVFFLLKYGIINSFLLIMFLAAFLWLLIPGKKYNAIFKNQVIKTFVKEYDENLDYNQNSGVTASIYQEGDFEKFDRFKSEDGILGNLDGNCKINMSEVHTEKEYYDEDGKKKYVTVFYGLFAQVDLGKFIKNGIKIERTQEINC